MIRVSLAFEYYMRLIKYISIVLLLLGCGEIYAQNGAINGYCTKGATPATTSGLNSTNTLQGIVPGGPAGCLVQVYLTGTVTPATIYSNVSGGSLTNPFRASLSGQWLFFASQSNKYDVVMSGGLPPNAYTTPVTLTGLGSGASGGGGIVVEVNGTPISPSSPANFVDTSTVTWQFIGGNIQATAVGGGGGNCGSVTGDNSSTDCGFNNRVGDTSSIPANVQTFGYTNLQTNSGQFSVAVGNNNGGGNPANETVLIGDTNGAGIPVASPVSSDVIGIGNDNLDTMSGQISDVVCEGDQNCRNIAWLNEAVAIGNSNLIHDVGTSIVDNMSVAIGIGLANGEYLNSGDTIVAIGQANVGGHTPSGSTNVFEAIGIGDSCAFNIGSNTSDIICIGDGSSRTIADDSTDIITIGDGVNKQCNTFTGCSGGAPNPATVHDVILIGDGTGSYNQASNVVGIGNQVMGSNIVGAAAGYYNQGPFNTVVGSLALVANSTGQFNTVMGGYAGCDGYSPPSTWGNCNHTGSNNTWIGYDSGPHSTTQFSNTLALGYQATVTASNQAVLGNGSMTDTELFGVTHVNGASGVAGGIQMKFGTYPGLTANNVGIIAPASGTAYDVLWPTAAPSGSNTLLSCAPGTPAVCSWAAGGGSGSNVTVNGGSTLSTANFNGTTPAAGAGFQNVTFQTSTTNVSAEVPLASSIAFGVAEVDNTTITASSGVISTAKAFAGSGTGLTTGPASGVTSGDIADFTGTGGQIADSGKLLSNVIIRDFGTTFGDTAGPALTAGSVVYFTVPYTCTIAAWNITVDAGTVTFDIWKIASGTAIPTVTNSITASAQPALSTGTAIHSTTLTGWTTSVSANDIFGFDLKTVATAKFAQIDLQCTQ